MPATRKAKNPSVPEESAQVVPQSMAHPDREFDPSFVRQMRKIVTAGLTPTSALDLVMRLIAEVPAASKESMDQIKMLDKLINTARAMMETKLKTDEAAVIAARIDELQHQLETLAASHGSTIDRITEG
jgi:hypothetical protein